MEEMKSYLEADILSREKVGKNCNRSCSV